MSETDQERGARSGSVGGRLAGKAALITGATSGIGETIARRLAAEGARVLATGRSTERGRRLAGELGPSVVFRAADLRAETAAEDLASATVDAFGHLDVLVNSAAIDHTGALLEVPVEEIRAAFEINAIAAIQLLQAAGRRMRDRGGSIINITSRLASIGVPTMGIYGATKGAVLSLTRAAAVELAPWGIRVNAIAPGMTKTPLYDAWIADQDAPESADAQVTAAIPLRRLATPDDVASAVVYLASDDSSYITGASIPVDGGYTAQ